MSAVIAVPELMAQAATDLTSVGVTVNAAQMTAAVPTVTLLPAAADEVSTSIAHLFSGYGQEYQKLAGQAAASYQDIVQHLTAGAGAYTSAEAANVSLLTTSAAASIPLFDEFIKTLIFASQIIENPVYLFPFLVLGFLALPFLPVGIPLFLVNLLLELPYFFSAFLALLIPSF